MSEKMLVQNFEQCASAPNAIQKLWELILQLAVQGRLVPQDPDDEPASILLNKIKMEKSELLYQKDARVSIKTEEVNRQNVVIPESWVLTTLGEVAHKITDGTHKTPNYINAGVPFVSVKDFSAGKLSFSNTRYISSEEHRTLYKRCDPRRGDILIGRIGTLGKAVLVETDQEFSLFVSVGLIRFSQKYIDPPFFRLLLNSPMIEAEFNRIKVGGGTHTNKLNLGDLHTIVVPLPPFNEQRRIVEKVYQLMKLCDELEVKQYERSEALVRFNTSALDHLLAANKANEFCLHWNLIRANFELLYDMPETVDKLQKAILQLAVQGKLVPQDPDDDPVSKLMESIDAERGGLRRGGERRIPESITPITDSEIPWKIPSHWQWHRLAALFLFIDYRGKTPQKQSSGVRLLTAKNIRMGNISLMPEEFVSENTYKSWMTRGIPRIGDVLFTTEAPLGNVAVLRLTERIALAQRTIDLRPFSQLNPDYVALTMQSPYFQTLLESKATGMTATGIKSAKLQLLPFPIPPLREQKRIVDKVTSLLKQCAELASQLRRTQSTSEQLMEAVVREVAGASIRSVA